MVRYVSPRRGAPAVSGRLAATAKSRRACAASNRYGTRCAEELLADQPVEESAHDAHEVIVAARPAARPRREELREHVGRDLLDVFDLPGGQEAVEQVELALFTPEAPTERALVGEEARDPVCEHAVQCRCPRPHRMVSPSPRATSRNASTATLV
jgi:hypothetical protein